MSEGPVLVTWVAVKNDPYDRDDKGAFKVENGEKLLGPTLTLLTDPASDFAGKVRDVVLLHQQPKHTDERVDRALEDLQAALRANRLRVVLEPWRCDDPTDHQAIFEFLRKKVPEIRRRFHDRQLVIHVSPGTPAMHTIWVLMAETGMIEQPFVAVKSYRREERRGRPAVVPVQLGIDTFYKAYTSARPRQVGSDDQSVVWDPERFRTDAMRRVYAEARRFAQVKVPILIRGERGTGKTTLASWIRSVSPFKRTAQDAHWPTVACGQYSPETMRSELFGHVQGAFTGATKERKGLLAAAHEDTLFLDEVGDVSPELQRLLIKVIEERRYMPLGSEDTKDSDFRLVTATNLDDTALRERLAPDFLDRISLLTLMMPPLRDIRAELPWLWEVVYAEARRRAVVSREGARLDAAHHQRILTAMCEHPLPGNLRDLFRVAYRLLAALGDEEAVTADDAVTIGLEALGAQLGEVGADSVPRAVAAAFAAGGSLDAVLRPGTALDRKKLFAEIKAYVADEVRRIARQRGVPVKELCGVSDRSLRDWVADDD